MKAGRHISASQIVDIQDNSHPYPCYGGNGLRGFVEIFNEEGDSLLIGRQGALCGNVQRVGGRFYATEHAVVTRGKESVDLNFAYHLLDWMNLNQYASKSAQPGLTVGKLSKLKVLIPQIAEQHRVASILDRFDRLTNDLSSGLPAEIEARRKQYEYYRDRLLSFDELAA